MKKYLSIFLLFLMSVILLSGCTSQKPMTTLEKIKSRDKIIIGTKFDSPPFGYIDKSQELKGFEIDFGKMIAKELLGSEHKAEFKQVLSSNRILALSSGEVDILIATMSITDQREKVITFSDPYFTTGIAILKNRNSDIKDITDLNNKSVLYVLGTTGEKELKILAPNAKLYGFRTYTDAYSALKAERAEALVTDKSILMGIVSTDNRFVLLPKIYTNENYGIGFKKGTVSESLRTEINAIIKKLNERGDLKNLIQKWGVSNV